MANISVATRQNAFRVIQFNKFGVIQLQWAIDVAELLYNALNRVGYCM